MKVVRASAKVLYPTRAGARTALKRLELAGRTCYKSEDRISEGSASKFAAMVLGRGHESVIEHISATFRISTDRGISHEIVRHRLASYSQESTRFVNYRKKGNGIDFVDPSLAFPKMDGTNAFGIWEASCALAEKAYLELEALGMPPELCRDVLPTSTRTDLVMTANVREWRHFCLMRCAPAAHPQMREIAWPILDTLLDYWPELFQDIAGKYPRPSFVPVPGATPIDKRKMPRKKAKP